MKKVSSKALLLLYFAISICIFSFAPPQAPKFRWDVKTLTDDSGIDWMMELQKARDNKLASIEGLTKKGVQYNSCTNIGKNTRRPDEKRVVKLKIRLIEVKKEDNDGDYHVVMQSVTNSSHYMVAEIPDPATDRLKGDKYGELRERFGDLRDKIKTLLGNNKNVTTSFKKFPGSPLVTVYGIPFWDCSHVGGVSNAAPDYREIHPVLDIEQ